MATTPFHASSENIERAKRKFDDLKGTINRFLQGSPYSVRTERHADMTHVIARRDKDLPADVGFDTPDIVLRLRAALDKALVTVVDINGRGTSGVGFPFGGFDRSAGQPNPFPDGRMTGKGGIKEKLTADQWAFVEAQRPYPGGNDILWAINQIANEDKHRKDLVELLPHFNYQAAVTSRDYNFRMDRLSFNPSEYDHVLSDKEREQVVMSAGDVTMKYNEVQHGCTLSVVFGELMPVTKKNVLVTLNQQIRMTDVIVAGLKRLAVQKAP